MACITCAKFEDISDLNRAHVVRTCETCGRQMRLESPGAHGIGIKITKGDRLVLPLSAITPSANPLKGGGQFTSYGLSRFAEMVFGVEILDQDIRNDFPTAIRAIMESNEQFFNTSSLLEGLDQTDPSNAEEIFKRIIAHPKTIEYWGYMAGGFGAIALDAIADGNAAQAAWAMAAAERFRALTIFKSNFEEAVLMGNSARRLVDLLHTWDSNKENSDEGFWQIQLSENAYAISQIFSVPVTMIQGRAYVGGLSLDGKDARFLDFMFSGGSGNDAILVEIKTPATKLLSRKYRNNVFPPSPELSGSIVQVNDYSHSLRENIMQIKKPGFELNTFNPRRVVIIGNYQAELTEPKKQKSFELFRTALAGIDVITFDELLAKVEHLARMFSLVRSVATPPG